MRSLCTLFRSACSTLGRLLLLNEETLRLIEELRAPHWEDVASQ
jgi:hypothetical protein